MAIQNRRGNYSDFDPDKMLPGEWGAVLADDPSSKNGKSVYMCFAPGDTKRMATYEDMDENIRKATEEIAEDLSDQIIAEAKPAIDQAVANAQEITQTLQEKLEAGEFTGPEGPRGPAGSLEGLEDETVEFTEPEQTENLISGDSVRVLFGKISKFMKGGAGTGILDKVYPVGSIYMSVNSVNPSALLGGVWEAWGAGRVPVSVDAGQTEFAEAELTGGEKEHALSVAELAEHTHVQEEHQHSLSGHTHSFSANTSGAGDHTHTGRWKAMNTTSLAGGSYLLRRISGEDSYDGISQVTDAAGNHSHSVSGTTGGGSGNTGSAAAVNQTAGEGEAHNNLQPYITCYMWKRTA